MKNYLGEEAFAPSTLNTLQAQPEPSCVGLSRQPERFATVPFLMRKVLTGSHVGTLHHQQGALYGKLWTLWEAEPG